MDSTYNTGKYDAKMRPNVQYLITHLHLYVNCPDKRVAQCKIVKVEVWQKGFLQW